MNDHGRCPACNGATLLDLGAVGPLPVLCGSLWESRSRALLTPTAKLDLMSCRHCGHVWNRTFDHALVDYDAHYDNALDFSPTFTRYADSLARRLVETYVLNDRTVVEIGSGKGDFLRSLCRLGGNRGLGFDPTYVGPVVDGDVRFVNGYFTPSTSPGDVDFLVCRHVLEHVEDPYDFLCSIRAAVDHQPVPMYFEVPNAEFNFGESGPWDLIYPHVAYFNETSLRALLHRSGFGVFRLEPSFDGQFLGAEVAPDPTAGQTAPSQGAGSSAEWVRTSFERQLGEVTRWWRRLDDLADKGPVALWGAGSKGVTFLSLVDSSATISTVVDANPRKWGRFLPGTGHEVVSPLLVAERSVASVLVTNPAYSDEIRASLAQMGARPTLLEV